MSDDLRDRIAEAIARAQDADYWVGEIARWERSEEWEREAYPDLHPDMAYEDRDDYRTAAQSVIDDLGLVVERTVRVVDHGAGPLRIPESRVVGKWER